MTTKDLAGTMQRCADALRNMPEMIVPGEKPIFEGEYAVGAAIFWAYLRGLLTAAGKDDFTRDELLITLETISRDLDMFPGGLLQLVGSLDQEKP